MRVFLSVLVLVTLLSCSKKEVRAPIPEENLPAELVKQGEQFYQTGDYENAFRAFGVVYYNYPSSREYIDAAIGMARTYGAMENYEKEFDILYTLLQGNLIPSKVPQIYTAIAEFYERSAGISEQVTGRGDEDYQTAISYYEKAISYPNSKDATAKSYAQYKIGTLYEKLGDIQKAIQAYQTTLNQYSGTEWALRAEQGIIDINERLRLQKEYEASGWFTADTTQTQTEESGTQELTPVNTPQSVDSTQHPE
ncbi:MAG: hypothetical protein D6748_07110 [Calditrichaeota bacterium]|nr:MAG: hypothetical protein D6748_07110 [Calditrichota bacterium]